MPLAFCQCKLQQSRSALLLIFRLTKKQHFPPAQGLSFSLTAKPLQRALAAQGARKVPCSALTCLKVGPRFHLVWYWPTLLPRSASIHSLRIWAHLGWVGTRQGLTCTLGWRRTAAAAEAPPTPPHSFPGHVPVSRGTGGSSPEPRP